MWKGKGLKQYLYKQYFYIQYYFFYYYKKFCTNYFNLYTNNFYQ